MRFSDLGFISELSNDLAINLSSFSWCAMSLGFYFFNSHEIVSLSHLEEAPVSCHEGELMHDNVTIFRAQPWPWPAALASAGS